MLRIGYSIFLAFLFISSIVWSFERTKFPFMANEIITEVDASEKDPIQSIEFLSNDEEPDPEDDEDHYLYKEYSIALCSLASNRLLIMFNQPNDPDLERLVPPPKHS